MEDFELEIEIENCQFMMEEDSEIPEYNKIDSNNDSIAVQRAKAAAQAKAHQTPPPPPPSTPSTTGGNTTSTSSGTSSTNTTNTTTSTTPTYKQLNKQNDSLGEHRAKIAAQNRARGLTR